MLEDAKALVRQARRIMVLTGAGMSQESGIRTFRQAQEGLWSQFRAEDLASPEGFLRDPALVWNWYVERARGVACAQPNAGHRAIAADASLAVVTQNVDRLHQRAGSAEVIELHGDIVTAICFEHCGWSAPLLRVAEHAVENPPHCPHCGSLVRPNVVWFGEALPFTALARSQALLESSDLCIVVGTSALVHPAAEMPLIARRNGASVIVVNPQPTDHDAVADVSLRMTAATALPAMLGSS